MCCFYSIHFVKLSVYITWIETHEYEGWLYAVFHFTVNETSQHRSSDAPVYYFGFVLPFQYIKSTWRKGKYKKWPLYILLWGVYPSDTLTCLHQMHWKTSLQSHDSHAGHGLMGVTRWADKEIVCNCQNAWIMVTWEIVTNTGNKTSKVFRLWWWHTCFKMKMEKARKIEHMLLLGTLKVKGWTHLFCKFKRSKPESLLKPKQGRTA